MANHPTKFSEQEVLSYSTDDLVSPPLLTVGVRSFDGGGWTRGASAPQAVKMTVSGTTTYVAKAPVGSSQASAVWQAMKIDESSGMVITFADGNANYDNVATDLTVLSYS